MTDAAPGKQPWWTVEGGELLKLLHRAAAGEDPDLIYTEEYANSSHEQIPAWEGELCDDCGSRYDETIWNAPDELWLELVGHPGGLLCPACFSTLARGRGIALMWEPRVDYRFDVDDT